MTEFIRVCDFCGKKTTEDDDSVKIFLPQTYREVADFKYRNKYYGGLDLCAECYKTHILNNINFNSEGN